MKQLRLVDCPVHESGLRLMDRAHFQVGFRQRHVVEIPPCCPISGNPQAGSLLTISYKPDQWVLEVYGLRAKWLQMPWACPFVLGLTW